MGTPIPFPAAWYLHSQFNFCKAQFTVALVHGIHLVTSLAYLKLHWRYNSAKPCCFLGGFVLEIPNPRIVFQGSRNSLVKWEREILSFRHFFCTWSHISFLTVYSQRVGKRLKTFGFCLDLAERSRVHTNTPKISPMALFSWRYGTGINTHIYLWPYCPARLSSFHADVGKLRPVM